MIEIRLQQSLRIVGHHLLASLTNDAHLLSAIRAIDYYIFPFFRGQPIKAELLLGDLCCIDLSNDRMTVAADVLPLQPYRLPMYELVTTSIDREALVHSRGVLNRFIAITNDESRAHSTASAACSLALSAMGSSSEEKGERT